MNLRQQIVQGRIESIAKQLNVPEDMAFLRLSHSLVTGMSLHDFDPADLIEGSQEKQIDTFTIEQGPDEASVFVLQVKNTMGFPSNGFILLRNGLEWVFDKKGPDVAKLKNERLRDKISEFRSVLSDLGPSNIRLYVAFVTNGLSAESSDECKQEAKTIRDKYGNGTFADFEFKLWGADELVERINTIEKRDRTINAELPIQYDTNKGTVIEYYTEGLKGIVCTADASEIAQIVNKDASEAVFDSNVRRFMGAKGPVNTDIMTTCSSKEEGPLFWFLNNGITIVCKDVEIVKIPDSPHVKIKDLQIVNGCQTSKVLALAQSEGRLAPNTRVLVRIYETQDRDLVDRLVLTTNNQNKISSRNLRSNDNVQVDMQRGFGQYGLLYERKPHEFDKASPGEVVVPNELVAQSYLGIVLRKPSDARRRKYKVWSDMYDNIFAGKMMIEPYVLATRIFLRTREWLRENKYTSSKRNLTRKLANNGAFHIARVASQLWRKGSKWPKNAAELKSEIVSLEANPHALDACLKDALDILSRTIRENRAFKADVDAALKSSGLDADIDKALASTQDIAGGTAKGRKHRNRKDKGSTE